MRVLIALSVSLLMLSCAEPPPEPTVDVAEVRRAIEANIAHLVEAYAAGDSATTASLYTDDAVVLPANGEVRRGKAAIQSGIESDLQIVSDLSLSTSDLEVIGDTANELGTYSIKLLLPGQEEAIEDRGKYMVVWKKQADGSWKLHWDIWNSDLPIPGTGSEQ